MTITSIIITWHIIIGIIFIWTRFFHKIWAWEIMLDILFFVNSYTFIIFDGIIVEICGLYGAVAKSLGGVYISCGSSRKFFFVDILKFFLLLNLSVYFIVGGKRIVYAFLKGIIAAFELMFWIIYRMVGIMYMIFLIINYILLLILNSLLFLVIYVVYNIIVWIYVLIRVVYLYCVSLRVYLL